MKQSCLWLTAFSASLLVACTSTDQVRSTPARMGTESAESLAAAPGAERLTSAMSAHVQRMSTLEPSGNTDYDYTRLMSTHYRGAIDLAEVELSAGQDPALQQLARQIVDQHPKAIRQLDLAAERLRTARANYKVRDVSDPFQARLTGATRSLRQPLMSSENVDQDFARLLTIHQQAGRNMSSAVLAHGHDSRVRKVAQKLLQAQDQNLAQLDAWQQQHARR